MNNQEQFAFKALADPTRRQILLHLSHGEKSIGELVSEFSMTRAAVKKHLDILNRGQMISVQPRGRERINRLKPEGIKSVSEWLTHFDQFWDDKLSALKHAIEYEQPEPSPPAANHRKKKTSNPAAKRKPV